MSLLVRKTFVYLQNTNEDILLKSESFLTTSTTPIRILAALPPGVWIILFINSVAHRQLFLTSYT